MKPRPSFVAVLSVLVILVSLVIAGCGDKAEVTGGPDTVVVKFMEAALAEDADTAFQLLDRESQAEVGDKRQLVEGFSESIESYSVGHPEVSEERARVPLSLKLKAFEPEVSFGMILVTEDGAWKISLAESEAEMEKAMEEFFQEVQPPS